MKLNEIFAKLENCVAPVSLSDEFCIKYGMRDNSGIILDSGSEVDGALFSLDFSPLAVQQAVSRGYNLIITHHPAIFHGINRLIVPCDPQAESIARCIRGGISVISMHLNFDCAPRGIDFFLMKGLGGEKEEGLMNVLSRGGYGRLYEISKQSFEEFALRTRSEFSSERIRFYKGSDTVSRAASFCGAGADEQSLKFALQGGADVFVSSDMKHHQITALLDAGVSVVEMTHYASEVYGFGKIYEAVKDKLGVNSAFFTDERLL